MVVLTKGDYKSLEQIIKEKKIKEVSIEMTELSKDGCTYHVKGDGEILYSGMVSNMPLPFELFKLQVTKPKKGFPLELSAIEVNLGLVKVKLDKKTKE
jgi:hypothetical protein